jgi:hypothetical protein
MLYLISLGDARTDYLLNINNIDGYKVAMILLNNQLCGSRETFSRSKCDVEILNTLANQCDQLKKIASDLQIIDLFKDTNLT